MYKHEYFLVKTNYIVGLPAVKSEKKYFKQRFSNGKFNNYLKLTRFFKKQALLSLHYSNILSNLFFLKSNFFIVESLDSFLPKHSLVKSFSRESQLICYLPISWSKRFLLNFFMNTTYFVMRDIGLYLYSKDCYFFSFSADFDLKTVFLESKDDSFCDLDLNKYSIYFMKTKKVAIVFKINEFKFLLSYFKKNLSNWCVLSTRAVELFKKLSYLMCLKTIN